MHPANRPNILRRSIPGNGTIGTQDKSSACLAVLYALQGRFRRCFRRSLMEHIHCVQIAEGHNFVTESLLEFGYCYLVKMDDVHILLTNQIQPVRPAAASVIHGFLAPYSFKEPKNRFE